MAFKSILVNLNHEARVPSLISAAAVLARPQECHVVGLYVMPPLFMPTDIVMPIGSEFYEQQIAEHKAQAGRIREVFEQNTKGEAFPTEWRVHGAAQTAYAAVADGVVAQARSAELVIVSQAIDGHTPPILADVPERVALESGRPVLVIPNSWQPAEYGRNVAIAWNDSREAARAAFDAIPMLRPGCKVRLLTAGATRDSDGVNTVPAAELAATLARHGLDVEIETIDDMSRNAGPAILARASACGADMLVMGAYGHSRMREFVLGGATREVLKSMPVPVFMSH